MADDPIPFVEVYRLYADRIYRFCLGMVRDPSLAEDLASDVFVLAMRSYESTRPDPDGLQAWLFRIAKNAVISYRRRQARYRRIMDRWSIQPATSVEDQVQLESEVSEVLAALAKLSKRDRTVVSLRIAGLSHAEIGQTLGTSDHAAAVASTRAFARLRAISRTDEQHPMKSSNE